MSASGEPRSLPGPPVRWVWMDVLRGFAVVLVVLAHVGLIVEFRAERMFPGLDDAINILQPLRMPMLFLLSGLLVPRSLAKGPRRYTSGKLKSIVYPYVLWTIVLALIASLVAAERTPLDIFSQLIMPTTHLWFLGFLIIFYGIALLCWFIHPLIFVVVAVALIILPVDPSWDALWMRAIAFFFGVAIGRDVDSFQRLLGDRLLCAVLAGASTALMAASVIWNWRSLDILWQSVIALMFFTGVAGLAAPIAEARVLKPLAWVGRRTIILYILHWTFAEGAAVLLASWHVNAFIMLGVTLLAAFLPPIAVMLLADRYRAVAWLFEWNPPEPAERRRKLSGAPRGEQ